MGREMDGVFEPEILPSAFVRAHEHTLLGAIDSYLSTLVHVRPYLARSYRQVLEAMAAQWLALGGQNMLGAIDVPWLNRYVGSHALRISAVQDFYAWADREGLLKRSTQNELRA